LIAVRLKNLIFENKKKEVNSMEIIILLYVFKILWLGFEVVSHFIRRKEEKTLDAEIIKRLKLLENKIKEINP
jgi:positive regulator of sigma E activity